MSDPRFDVTNLNRNIGHAARKAISELVLAWATYDSLVSQWVIVTFSLPLDAGAILVGNMNTETKLERLETLYRHHGVSGAASIKILRKEHLVHVTIRNRVCHAHCAGRFKSDPDRIVFAPVKQMTGNPGEMLVEALHIDQMVAATVFAKNAAKNINRLIEAAIPRGK
ncbi:MAG: hypothetical protein QOD42_2921 [Sphingomonadales bacterium]|jgi:hypothetical protein|nr:hypothetical protein [Sphingomonadales bacterium]